MKKKNSKHNIIFSNNGINNNRMLRIFFFFFLFENNFWMIHRPKDDLKKRKHYMFAYLYILYINKYILRVIFKYFYIHTHTHTLIHIYIRFLVWFLSTKLRAKCRVPWKSLAVWEKQDNTKKASLLDKRSLINAKTLRSPEKTNIGHKEQLADIQSQINKIRNLLEDRILQYFRQ